MTTYGRYHVEITSPDKILFPQDKITKLDLIEYYEHIAPVMLPYLKDRMLTMQRFPDGITHEGFYHKDMPDYFPPWIKHVAVKKQDGGLVHYVVCNNTETLVYLANAACITPHLFLSKITKQHYPDQMIFDLDPSGNNDFAAVKKIAKLTKNVLEELGLVSFVKTTGSRGLHVLVPLNRRHEYDDVRAFAQSVAQVVHEREPKITTLEVRKAKRAGKVFIDTLRNSFSATAVAPYAVRPHPGAPVATPIYWEDLSSSSLRSTTYTIKNIFKRLDREGDAWAGITKHAQSLTKAIKAVEIL